MGWLMWSCQLLCLQLVLLHSLSFALLVFSTSHEQSSALLHFKFKQLFSFVESGAYRSCDTQLHYPKMKYWKEDIDCCTREGVTCDMVTGHLIGLDLNCSWLYGRIPSNSSLFLLSHLKKLNLASNDFNLSEIPFNFVRFPSLIHLILSSSNFYCQVPFEITHLSKLISLDLAVNGLDEGVLTLKTPVMEGIVHNLTELEELVLDDVTMSTVGPGYLTNLSSSLTLLSISVCQSHGSFPENIFHFPNLRTLELSGNYLLTCSFPKVNWSSPLMYLDVSSTQFSGEMSDSIENLKSLEHLDIRSCMFIGSIPTSLVISHSCHI
ncbi:hypothetical protein Dsin_003184 [Dipteronia sinensis]|uniref:Leucine-rich repeat-containing N-terminal plant-type domain-containing protein n=1 Tax=Dipteronia sinensis TaxID=43782 RepID=A0AAE0B8I0_9ROSI|nr:hypothetical protein Dsin_003184 [Dipteronia sinensis]